MNNLEKGTKKATKQEYYIAYEVLSSLIGGGKEVLRDKNLNFIEDECRKAVSSNPSLEYIIIKTSAEVKEEVVNVINQATVSPPSIFEE